MKKYAYMIKVYAYLVKAGKYAISAEEKENEQEIVPPHYQEDVAAYLAKQAG